MVFVTQFCLSLDLCRVWLRTGYQLPRLARLADIRRARSRAICFYHTTSPARLIRWGGQQRRITQIQEISPRQNRSQPDTKYAIILLIH